MQRALYTHGHHDAVLRSHSTRTAANSAAYLLPQLRPGQSLLDVGCGAGTITVDLATEVAPGPTIGVDASPSVLDPARRLAKERGLTTVTFAEADVHGLDFADETFDVVHAHQVLQHVGDPVGALREMRRVCKPGGVVAARDADYAAMTWYPEIPALDEWLALYRRTARYNGGEPDAGRRLLSWARRAGITEVTASAGTWCYTTEAERAWWSQTWAERITDSPLAEQALSYGFATERDLRRMAEGWRTWGASADAWFTVLHGEILCHV